MNLKLFLSILCLLVFPILSIAQSFEDPLGQINNSVHNVTKDWIQYLAFGFVLVAVCAYIFKRKFNTIVILLVIGALILFLLSYYL